MTERGTAAYDGVEGLPPLVRSAVASARAAGFDFCCLPQQGMLLRLLAGGAGAGVIGETGTGFGAGLAWLADGARPGARLISVEHEPARAAAAAAIFSGAPNVEVHAGGWQALHAFGPFDLLVLDGGGQGKGDEPPLDPARWMRPGGLIVIDDFTPLTGWPPTFAGKPDPARRYWLDHPRLRATQVNVTPDSATILATYVG
ncbi:class I SAM-dependent methyltransferase [Labedaea rhizosphaerae]|uniref:Putative O-methyltransferase YrrM n=1 Tax=Labedaea rhizosphaerae TaxID=598644 RepID=A0A4R6S6C8_LABRH|nr:class I SAM-dependent methyltransferase [Labedaea rhizosphaerae]TDP94903.1 putative O-methyltransferase YrrM [Labedaea rhizosphaerae]